MNQADLLQCSGILEPPTINGTSRQEVQDIMVSTTVLLRRAVRCHAAADKQLQYKACLPHCVKHTLPTHMQHEQSRRMPICRRTHTA
jgi:hypothetical protein